MLSLPMKIIVFLVYQIGQLTPTGSKLCSKTINKGYSKYNPHIKTFDFDQQWNERLKRVKNKTRSCFPYPYRPKCTSQRGGWVLLVICKSLNLSSFLFLFYNFYRGIEMNFSWLVASIAVPPYLFFKKKKTPLQERVRSLLFFINSQRALIHRN